MKILHNFADILHKVDKIFVSSGSDSILHHINDAKK